MSRNGSIVDGRAIRRALLAWYRETRRDLPWRRTRDPYAILVSETMLQQTRVETVLRYYERFPDLDSLATADTDDVLGEWAGLGYYSRARNLRAAARQVIEKWEGELPPRVENPRGCRHFRGLSDIAGGPILPTR